MIKQPIVTTVSSTKDPDYFPHSGTALAVRLLADRVNWLSVVDTLLPWDRARSRIAPSVLLLMLVINVLTHRNPLYGVESWAATLPLPLLWGENIQASQFNDDALGRVLEDVADHGSQLLATLGMRMQGIHPTLSDWLHSDTTAYALMGDYPSATTGPTAPVHLTWGHSKDHRPDLKQIMAGVTMDAEGCLLAGTMLSGNTSDQTWNADWVDQLAKDFPENFWQGKCYIADAAMVSNPAIARIRAAGMHWLGRLSARFNLCDELKVRAWAQTTESWDDLGHLAQVPTPKSATYQAQTFDVTFYDEPARAFVYHSRALDKKKEHTLQREMAQEREQWTKMEKKLAGKTFQGVADAEQAATLLRDSFAFHWYTVTPIIGGQDVPVKRRGRPKAGVPIETHREYPVTFQVTDPTPEAIQAERERRSTFILLTSNRTLDAKTALQEYKGQDQNEHGFRWTKSPIHLGAFWLEKPARVAGLGYLLLLALQFARFMRALVRAALQDQPPLELPHRRVKRPSETVILDALRDLDIRRQSNESLLWYQWTAVLPYQRRLLDALGVPIDRGFIWDPSG